MNIELIREAISFWQHKIDKKDFLRVEMSQIECLIFFYRFTHFPVLDKFNIVDFWNQFFIILTVSFSVFLSFSFFCLVWRNVSTSRRSSHCSRREITYSSHLFMFSCYVWSFLMLLCLKLSHVMFEVGRFSLLQEVMLCLKVDDFQFYKFLWNKMSELKQVLSLLQQR